MAKKTARAKKRTGSEVVPRGGKPAAVILGVEHYRGLVERAQDSDDLKVLDAMRRKPLRFRKLDDFLDSYSPDA